MECAGYMDVTAMTTTSIKGFADIGDAGAPVGSPEWCKYAHGVLCSTKRRTTSEVSALKYALIEFKKFERWRQLADDAGEPFQSWEDYLQYPEPNGLGMPPASAKLVMEELDDSRLLGDVLGQHGGDRGMQHDEHGRFINLEEAIKLGRHSGDRDQSPQGDNVTLAQRGNSRAYILARLDRDGLTDLAAKVRAGAMSANAAAIEAGWREKPTPLQQIRRLLLALTSDELQSLLRELQEKCREAA
jgi:hypothetical protein